MSAGYGIASFVDGFFKGRDIRHGWEDRKDNKERQKKLDEIQFAQERRAQEAFDWDMGTRKRTRADEDAMRTAQEAALDATRESMDAPATEPLGATPNTATAALPPATAGSPPAHVLEIANNLAMDKAIAGGSTTKSTKNQPAPTVARPQDTATMPVDPRLAVPPGGMPANPNSFPDMNAALGAIGADAVGYRQGQVDPRLAGAAGMVGGVGPQQGKTVADPISGKPVVIPSAPQGQIVPPMPMPQNPRLVTSGPGPTGAGMEELYQMGAIPRRFETGTPQTQQAAPVSLEPDYTRNFGERGGFVGDVAEGGKRAIQLARNIGPKLIENATPDRAIANAVKPYVMPAANAVSEYVFGATIPGMEAPQGADPRVDMPPSGMPAAPQPASPTGAGPRIANLPNGAPAAPANTIPAAASSVAANLPPAERALANEAMAGLAAANSPAIQKTAETAPLGATPSVGKDGKPKPITEAQRTRAADAFIEQYMKVGAPMVVEEMLRQGKLDQAKGFMDWIETTSTKAAMKDWSRAAFAATVGDFDSFAEHTISAYNRLDYFPDGTTIVKDQSGFTRDRDGNINGAKITFRDEETGNTFDQVFEGPDDLIRMGTTLLAPEMAYQAYVAQEEARKVAALGAQEKADGKAEKDQGRIDDIAAAIFKESIGLDGKPTISYQEALRQAQEAVSGKPEGAAAEGEVPMVYRP